MVTSLFLPDLEYKARVIRLVSTVGSVTPESKEMKHLKKNNLKTAFAHQHWPQQVCSKHSLLRAVGGDGKVHSNPLLLSHNLALTCTVTARDNFSSNHC